MDSLLLDSRLALRRLKQSPGFAAAAIVTLALGIGANTTTFSVINKLILRPRPVTRPQELVFLNTASGIHHSYPNYKDFRDNRDVLVGGTLTAQAPIFQPLYKYGANVFMLQASLTY